MIAQTKAYNTNNNSAFEIPLAQAKEDDPNHVTVHELIFALSGDDIVPSLWFNIPLTEITECSHKQQLKYNRKKARAKDVLHNQQTSKEQCKGEDQSTVIKFAPGDEAFRHHHQDIEPAFPIFYPGDDALSTLISATMRLELDSLRHSKNFSSTTYRSNRTLQDKTSKILCLERTLRRDFRAVKSHFIMSYWPVNMDRQFVTDDTPVPAIDSTYKIRDTGIHHNLWQAFVYALNPHIEQTHTIPSVSHRLLPSSSDTESDVSDASTRKRLSVFERMTSSSSPFISFISFTLMIQ